MLGKYFILSFLFLALWGCNNRTHEEVTQRRIIQMIDNRDYDQVISFFEHNMSAEEKTKNYPLLAQAYMGKAHLEPVDFVQGVRNVSHYTQPQLEQFARHCPQESLSWNSDISPKCVLVRLFEQLLQVDYKTLRKSQEIWKKLLSESKLSEQDKLLMSMVEAAFILHGIGDVLTYYAGVDEKQIDDEVVQQLFTRIRNLALDLKDSLSTLRQDPQLLSQKLTGLQKNKLFQWNQENTQLQFLDETALPLVLDWSSLKNQSVKAIVARGFIIENLDKAVNTLSQ